MLKYSEDILDNLFKHSTLTIIDGMLLCENYEDVSYILKGTDVNIEDNVYLLMLLELTCEYNSLGLLKGWHRLKLNFYYKLKEEYGDDDMYNLINF